MFNTLKAGERYSISKDRERIFPLHTALLVVDNQWNFYGYCVAHSAVVKEQKTQIDFEMLSLFNPDEQKTYKDRFVEAAKLTGEIK